MRAPFLIGRTGNCRLPSTQGSQMPESFGQSLRRYRTLAGLSQPKLARAAFVSQSLISKMEAGAEEPSRAVAEACDRALGADGVLVAMLKPLRPVSAGSDPEPWELTDVLTRRSLSPETLDHMRRATLGFASRYPGATPMQLLPLVNAQLRRLRQALDQPQTIATRREAVALLGVLSGIAGNLSLDTGEREKAGAYFGVGRLAGEESEDSDLMAWVLATHSIERFYADDFPETVALLDEAHLLAQKGASARRRAWITALRARAHAAMRQDSGALRDLDEAYRLIAGAGTPEGTDFFDEARLGGIAGSAHVLLRRTEDGAALLARAVAERASSDAKGRSLLTLDLAECRATEHEYEEAVELVDQAVRIAGDGMVQPIRDRVAKIAAQLGIQHPPGSQ